MIVATVLQTISNSFGMFIGARYGSPLSLVLVWAHQTSFHHSFLIGFGLTFAAAAAPLLVTEIAFPTQRAQATSMYNTLW